MEECRRTRSQGPPSLPEGNELGQWGSLPDPSRLERECSEALRLARQVNTATNMNKNTVESSEISQVTSEQRSTLNTPPIWARSHQNTIKMKTLLKSCPKWARSHQINITKREISKQ